MGQVSAQSLRARGLTSDRTTNIYRHKAQHMQKPQSTTVVPLRRVSLRVNKSSPNPTITFSAPSHQLQYIGALLQRLGSLKATQVAKYGNRHLWPVFVFSARRADTAHLNWNAEHVFGSSTEHLQPIVVINPEDEAAYRTKWPDATLCIMPCEDRGISFCRWMILHSAFSWRLPY